MALGRGLACGMQSRVRCALLLSALVILLSGCEPNRAYWMAGRGAEAAAVLPRERDAAAFYPQLAVVEIDEQGDLWCEDQVNRAARMMKSTPKPPLLFVYVHGWQNNARPTNKDLHTFSDYLTELAKNPRIAREFTVTGVFIGWRGATLADWLDDTVIGRLPRLATFWSRLGATNRVAGVPLTRAIGEIVAASREHSGGPGVSVLLGYSFGGRIVERTLGQALVMQHALAADRDGAIFPADLTILINSASEALYAREIKLALRTWSDPRPAIISVTADSDMVTSVAWPFGQFVQHIFGGFRSYARTSPPESQRKYVFSTAGHRPETFTHEVNQIPARALPPEQSAFEFNTDSASPGRFYVTDDRNRLHAFAMTPLPPDRPRALPVGGYWVVDVPPVILQGHGGIVEDGGIFSRQITELIAAFFRVTQAEASKDAPPAD